MNTGVVAPIRLAAEAAAKIGSVLERLSDFADVLGGMIGCNDDVFTGFSCGEIEVLADLLVLGGHESTAQAVLIEHAQHDDCGDTHFGLRVAWDRLLCEDDGLMALAAAYLGVREQWLPGWTAMTVRWPSAYPEGGEHEGLYACRMDAMTGLRTMLPRVAEAAAPRDDEALPEYVRGLGADLEIEEMPTVVVAIVDQPALPAAEPGHVAAPDRPVGTEQFEGRKLRPQGDVLQLPPDFEYLPLPPDVADSQPDEPVDGEIV